VTSVTRPHQVHVLLKLYVQFCDTPLHDRPRLTSITLMLNGLRESKAFPLHIICMQKNTSLSVLLFFDVWCNNPTVCRPQHVCFTSCILPARLTSLTHYSRCKKSCWEGVDWIDLAQDSDRSRAFVNAVMNLRAPLNAASFLTSWRTVGFSKGVLLSGASVSVSQVG